MPREVVVVGHSGERIRVKNKVTKKVYWIHASAVL